MNATEHPSVATKDAGREEEMGFRAGQDLQYFLQCPFMTQQALRHLQTDKITCNIALMLFSMPYFMTMVILLILADKTTAGWSRPKCWKNNVGHCRIRCLDDE
ncbi:hypothetical protein A6R68_17523, partial [Neotoma lepida]